MLDGLRSVSKGVAVLFVIQFLLGSSTFGWWRGHWSKAMHWCPLCSRWGSTMHWTQMRENRLLTFLDDIDECAPDKVATIFVLLQNKLWQHASEFGENTIVESWRGLPLGLWVIHQDSSSRRHRVEKILCKRSRRLEIYFRREHCVFWETTSFQSKGCLRNRLQFRTVQQNQKSFSWMQNEGWTKDPRLTCGMWSSLFFTEIRISRTLHMWKERIGRKQWPVRTSLPTVWPLPCWPTDVSCNDASNHPSKLLQNRHPPHAQRANDFVWHVASRQLLCRMEQERRIGWRLQERPDTFNGHPWKDH